MPRLDLIEDGCAAFPLTIYQKIVSGCFQKEHEDKENFRYEKLIGVEASTMQDLKMKQRDRQERQMELENQTEIFDVWDDFIEPVESKIFQKAYDYLEAISESDKFFDPQDPRAIWIQKYSNIPVFKEFVNNKKLLFKDTVLSQPELVTFLLSIGADINIQSGFGMTPLRWALRKSYFHAAELLLADQRVDVNNRDELIDSPLYESILIDKTEIAKLLLKNPRFNVDIKDSQDRTPLHWAANFDAFHIAQLLLVEPKTNVNAQDSQGRTPLHRAVISLKINMVGLLLEDSRVNPNITDMYNRTPLDYVKPVEDEMLQLFREKISIVEELQAFCK